MARPEGFEPPTPWFVARYSIQLSYGRIFVTGMKSQDIGNFGGPVIEERGLSNIHGHLCKLCLKRIFVSEPAETAKIVIRRVKFGAVFDCERREVDIRSQVAGAARIEQ